MFKLILQINCNFIDTLIVFYLLFAIVAYLLSLSEPFVFDNNQKLPQDNYDISTSSIKVF